MSENLMPKIAEMLGVEMGEKFEIENTERNVCVVLAADGLHISEGDYFGIPNGKLLQKVLCGLYEVKKLPWEPKDGENYYYANIERGDTCCGYWQYDTLDYAMKALGMIYRSRKEAEAHFAQDYEKLTGKKVVDK